MACPGGSSRAERGGAAHLADELAQLRDAEADGVARAKPPTSASVAVPAERAGGIELRPCPARARGCAGAGVDVGGDGGVSERDGARLGAAGRRGVGQDDQRDRVDDAAGARRAHDVEVGRRRLPACRGRGRGGGGGAALDDAENGLGDVQVGERVDGGGELLQRL